MDAALMHESLERAALRFGDRAAIRSGDEHWSFCELDGLSNAFARHLAARGVTAGDRVALMTANRVEFILAVHATSKMGAAAVLLSPAWKRAEVRHALELTTPVYAVADGEGSTLLAECLGSDAVTDLDDPSTDPFAHSRARTASAGVRGADGGR